MKPLLDALKGARKIEIWIMVAMLCVLLVLSIGRAPVNTEAQSDEERRLERILAQINGAGSVSVMLSEDDDGAQGCVVAAEGADNIAVMLSMQRAVQALTGLELDSIEIVQSKR